jgi:hypothetical protein
VVGGGATRATLLALFIAALLFLAAVGIELADGESTQRGRLISYLDGGISPRSLPRDHPVPAALTISGGLRTADHSPIPRVSSIEIALADRGSLATQGLPACHRDDLLATTTSAAISNCGRALVGHGRLAVSLDLPNQPRFRYRATILAFNTRFHRRPGIWLHINGDDPPSTFVLPVSTHRGEKDFPTALRIAVPPAVGTWPHLARFHLTLSRRYTFHGRKHSYLNASCPLPPRFTAGIFPFARATYSLPAGKQISTTIIRGCRAG